MVCEIANHGDEVVMAHDFLCLSRAVFIESSPEMDVENYQCYSKRQTDNNLLWSIL